MGRVLQPVLAGVVTAVIGFGGAFPVVLSGLRAVGADEHQAASGLLVVSVASGLVAIVLGLRTRMPISIAWSTPGAALLLSAGAQPGGFPAAVGAFLLCGVLIVVSGLVPALARLVAAIPAHLAGAMLAGVLLPLCIAPVHAVAEIPLLAAPVVIVWAVLARFARRWAVPAALVVAVVLIAVTGPGLSGIDLAPVLVWTPPSFDVATLVGVGLPLFLVTMASQNVTGMAVLAQFGYRPKLGPILGATGVGTLLGAPFGGHAVNLAAISAALAAGPDAGPPERRWIASVTAGAGMIVLGLGAGAATAVILLSPPVLVSAVAGLALLGALTSSVAAALADEQGREAAIVTFVVTAAGVGFLGIGGAFWGLLAGGAMALLHRRRARPDADQPASPRLASSGAISGSRPRKAR
ncbi:benzoate/H(+) symporter BenE family transporter [Pseudonocardia sp. GCM10023141]|uniref:benzoate/H(+) symporter BenE family transporter n=1 Tax=Pseudonocardia sp. GCM10023141 TaxID=3252653 RepID=UPI003612AA57